MVNGGILDLSELGANPSFHGHYVPSIMERKLRKVVHGIDFFALFSGGSPEVPFGNWKDV